MTPFPIPASNQTVIKLRVLPNELPKLHLLHIQLLISLRESKVNGYYALDQCSV